ncbi:DUF3124 domain-containing protein [Roseibium album]
MYSLALRQIVCPMMAAPISLAALACNRCKHLGQCVQVKIPFAVRNAMFKSLSGLFFSLAVLWTAAASAQDVTEKVLGETIYVPAYSRIFSYPNRSDLLATTLAVHNVDPDTTLTLTRVDYHGEDGKLLRSLLEAPFELAPLQSKTVLIPINDTSGGVGANFIVVWTAGKPTLGPIAEAIMTSGSGGPGPSFTSRGRVIARQQAE